MRITLKSFNANCPASNLKYGERLIDLVRSADILRLYFQIRLGADVLIDGWRGQMRHRHPVRVTARPVSPWGTPTSANSQMTAHVGVGLSSRGSSERSDGTHLRHGTASVAR